MAIPSVLARGTSLDAVAAPPPSPALSSVPSRDVHVKHADIVFDRFRSGDRRLVGRGSYGVVYRATFGGSPVAVKIRTDVSRRASPRQVDEFWNEVNVQHDLNHANVVRVFGGYEFVDDEEPGAPHEYGIVMELMECACDAEVLAERKLTASQRFRIVVELATALQYIHDRNLIHSDVKPANVLLDGAGTAKLSDFGGARLRGPTDATRTTFRGKVGTPLYMDALLWRQEDSLRAHSDVYSWAITAWEILTGRVPYMNADGSAILMDALQRLVGDEDGRPDLALLPVDTPACVSSLLSMAWSRQASRRPVMKAIVTALTTAPMVALAPPDGDAMPALHLGGAAAASSFGMTGSEPTTLQDSVATSSTAASDVRSVASSGTSVSAPASTAATRYLVLAGGRQQNGDSTMELLPLAPPAATAAAPTSSPASRLVQLPRSFVCGAIRCDGKRLWLVGHDRNMNETPWMMRERAGAVLRREIVVMSVRLSQSADAGTPWEATVSDPTIVPAAGFLDGSDDTKYHPTVFTGDIAYMVGAGRCVLRVILPPDCRGSIRGAGTVLHGHATGNMVAVPHDASGWRLYMFGGFDKLDAEYHAHVEWFDTRTESSHTVPDLPRGLVRSTAAVYVPPQQRIYVLGGHDNSKESAVICALSTKSDAWLLRIDGDPVLEYPIAFGAAVFDAGRVYVAGHTRAGSDYLPDVLRFIVEKDSLACTTSSLLVQQKRPMCAIAVVELGETS